MRIEEKDGKLVIADFNNMEAYKIAAKIEKDGMDFYRELSKKAHNKKQKEVFDFLLGKEKEHLAFFQDSLSRLREKDEDTFEEDDIFQYMDYGIFIRPAEEENIFQDIEKAIKMAIRMEERSQDFYQACLKHTEDRKTAGELKEIIDEEIKHERTLKDILQYHMY